MSPQVWMQPLSELDDLDKRISEMEVQLRDLYAQRRAIRHAEKMANTPFGKDRARKKALRNGEILALLRNGDTKQAIAERYGVGMSAVYQWVREAASKEAFDAAGPAPDDDNAWDDWYVAADNHAKAIVRGFRR